MKINKKKLKIWLFSVLVVIILTFFAGGIYVSDYYPADKTKISSFTYSESISKKEINKSTTAYIPEKASIGLIFYPGGKVEASSYEPLMMAFAQKGILSVLIEMPFNLAVLNVNAADEIIEQFPEVDNWYMCGHSLGGSMAASYIQKNTSNFKGLILLAAYSTADISKSGLDVISIYGSEDKVLNLKKYDKYKQNLPKEFNELIIDGGCHAYFGVYGHQEGDGSPFISNSEQINITAEKVYETICK